LHQRLRRNCYLLRLSDCYRLERPVAGRESHPLDINTFHDAQLFDHTGHNKQQHNCPVHVPFSETGHKHRSCCAGWSQPRNSDGNKRNACSDDSLCGYYFSYKFADFALLY
ncbi:MAG: hypothetical protein ABGZ53_21020, partial [Fuerstiella sp.]